MTRSITPFHSLRFNSLLNADSTSRKANVLEALIIQASDLAHSIQHPDLWEKNQLS